MAINIHQLKEKTVDIYSMEIQMPELAEIWAKLNKALDLLENQPTMLQEKQDVRQRLLNVEEVAKYLGVTKGTVY